MTVDRSPLVSGGRGTCEGVLPDTPDCGLTALPDTDDGLAALYAWPERSAAPYVRANMIASLDGGTTVDGRSAGLGNKADEGLFAILRDLAEVILVGSGTVRAERYGGVRLDAERRARRVRWGAPAEPPPIAVVTGRGLDPQQPLFTDTVTPPIVITTRSAAATVPASARVIVAGTDSIDLTVAVAELADCGIRQDPLRGRSVAARRAGRRRPAGRMLPDDRPDVARLGGRADAARPAGGIGRLVAGRRPRRRRSPVHPVPTGVLDDDHPDRRRRTRAPSWPTAPAHLRGGGTRRRGAPGDRLHPRSIPATGVGHLRFAAVHHRGRRLLQRTDRPGRSRSAGGPDQLGAL